MRERADVIKEIKGKLIELRDCYGKNSIKAVFNVPGQTDNIDKVKHEISEFG